MRVWSAIGASITSTNVKKEQLGEHMWIMEEPYIRRCNKSGKPYNLERARVQMVDIFDMLAG